MFLMEEGINFCTKTANAWQIVGYVLLVFKIVIPILLIIFGMLDLGKAVTQSDEKAITKATMALVRRAIAAVVIFFIPTLVGVIMGLVTGFTSKAESDYENCRKCITNPTGKTCNEAAEKAWGNEKDE